MFPRASKNQNIEKIGRIDSTPLFRVMRREWDRRYIKLAPANIPDEHTPWAIIIRVAARTPQAEFKRYPATTNPMWLTEE
jgi:hypothetical protein